MIHCFTWQISTSRAMQTYRRFFLFWVEFQPIVHSWQAVTSKKKQHFILICSFLELLVPRSTGILKATKTANAGGNKRKLIEFDRAVTIVGLSYYCTDWLTTHRNLRVENLLGSECYWAVGLDNVSRHLLSVLEFPLLLF